MTTSAPRSSQATSSRQGPAARLPIETRPDDPDALIQALQGCSADDLRRARRHYRRALRALTDGRYSALSDETRRRLIGHMREDLTALNRALASTSASAPSDNPSSVRPSGLWSFLQALW
ncbi:MAG: hypothetical protein R6T83_09465 [Salinibacter sp.]